MKKKLFLIACTLQSFFNLTAQKFITEQKESGSFPIVSASQTATIYVDEKDHTVVQKAAAFLQGDIEKVSGKKASLQNKPSLSVKNAIIIGSLDKSNLIQQLVKEKKLNIGNIKDKWEAFTIQLVHKPLAGVESALVIIGNDRRGTVYGVFELSQQIGVSPWWWWADVPVKKKEEIYVKKSTSKTDSPKVKYRGIFINDEAPALSGWSKEKFGGFNHTFYEKVFELILRMKGNYLWPAMWGNAFYDDDTLNKQTADDYAIVIGTSHHEPLLRAHDEWRRYGSGKWNYDSNEIKLREFWKGGIQRARNTETIVSVGMRGDGDEPMTRGTATALLERIVRDQREIIKNVSGKDPSATPQLWALYKEVQDYYDKGMRVPDDVTLLLCDDNWGNIRKLPRLDEKPRAGGYGIYYHFDYVGGPRNYKWLNTNPIPRVWEQMHLAWQHNVRQIWIVNVGDIKPMEFPISFFLDYAWNPEKINADDLQHYTRQWAAEQFGDKHSVEIADIISKYAKYNGRRKPELLDENTYSIHHYNEAERVVREYNELLVSAEKINTQIPPEYRDAYFQLVLHPVKAYANLLELYVSVAWNKFYASQGMAIANKVADKAKQHYISDSLITLHYHKQVANGKWNHMMSQTHIGYTYWQQPRHNKMPEVKYVPADSIVDVPPKITEGDFTARHLIPKNNKSNAFYELNGYVSIEAPNYTNAVNTNNISWKILPDHGRTGSAITAFPVTAMNQEPGKNSPYLEYDLYVYDTGNARVHAYFSPTLNFHNTENGLQYGISIDDEPPQIISINKEDNNIRTWGDWVANNIIIKTSRHPILKPGKHVLKYWMVSPGVVLQKLVIDFGGLKSSYLGPPETKMN